jgi:hypothetical protein
VVFLADPFLDVSAQAVPENLNRETVKSDVQYSREGIDNSGGIGTPDVKSPLFCWMTD